MGRAGGQRRRAAVLVAVLLGGAAAGCSGSPTSAPATHSPRPGPLAPSDTPHASSPATGGPPADGGHRPTGEPVTLAFGGDVHFEGSVRRRLDADPDTVLAGVAAPLRAADLAVVNLETAVTDRGRPEPKQYTFRAPATALRALSAAGVDVATVANNHGLDYGQVGLADTLAAGRASQVALVGAGQDEAAAFAPYRTTVKGQRITVIGATQVLDAFAVERWAAGPGKPGLASAKHEQVLLDAVRRARTDSDTVVVDLHWGQERVVCPTTTQRDLARLLVDAGADVVVGSHAHVLLGQGWLDGAFVHYGLGNFVFYASGGGPATRSGVLTLTTRGHAVTDAAWAPAVLADGATTLLTGSAAAAAAAAHAAQRGCTGLSARP